MKKDSKKIVIISIGIVLLTLILCGCLGTEVDDDKSNVVFESEIVNLLDYNLELNRNNNNEINQATVTGRIHNKLDRQVNVKLTSKFYDEKNEYVGEETFRILGLRKINEPGDSTTFTITYDKDNCKLVDHAKLSAVEIDA